MPVSEKQSLVPCGVGITQHGIEAHRFNSAHMTQDI